MTDAALPWYEAFFKGDYLDVYGHEFTVERAAREVGFVERALTLRPGDAVLDLCCGQGRHAVLLAKRGYRVTGQDLNHEYLDIAAESARVAGFGMETVRSDMRVIPFAERFDAIINMFTAFGYLESEEEDLRVLQAIARALKPGGRLLMDLLNREWVVANYAEKDWHAGEDGTLYLERRRLDLATSRNHVTFTAVSPQGGRREVGGHHVRLYTLTEVVELLTASGLRLIEVYGGFEDEPYSIATRRMIVVAEKSPLTPQAARVATARSARSVARPTGAPRRRRRAAPGER
jgi:SAM-dependent methyltransferase